MKKPIDHYQMIIAGKKVDAERRLPVFNPATRSVIATVPEATPEHLDSAVRAARNAFALWRATSINHRRTMFDAMADILDKHVDELCALLTKEQGKPRPGAEWEVRGSSIWFREIGKMTLSDEVVYDSPSRRVVTRFSPLGVVGAITPWNFPILLAVWKIASALITGNCVVVKPSPFTPLCTLRLVELFQDILPPGVLNAVSGGDDLGKWMTAHTGIDKIAFTGHTETGKQVMRASAATLKRLTLELGGNDPAIVLADVDAKAIAPKLFWAAFQNNAQFCNATKRLFVHEKVYDDVLEELVKYTRGVKVGDGAESETQLGPIQNEPQYKKVLEYFEDCKRNGYRFAVGGTVDQNSPGWFVPVTLVDNPPDDSRIVAEEPFGPILPLLKWNSEEEVVRRSNDSQYGLAASVWGNNLEIVERIGARLEAGTVWLNEIHQYSPHQAFGGHKQSGLGCENSLHGLMEYTNWQTIALNRELN